ncbi:MAG: alpha/beta hydrolase [Xanthomarina sp.]
MKVFKFYLFIYVLLLFFVSCSTDDNNLPDTGLNPSEYYQELNVSYGSDFNQVFDIYLPANRTLDTNIMILVHGGGWAAGDKNDMNEFRDYLRATFPDMGIVNINYRLANETHLPYPMQLNDITAVINHLKSKKNYYVIDNDFGFIGVSAGAHLALLWSYAFDINNDINMVCSLVGPTNLTDPAYLNSTDPILQGLIGLFGENASTNFLEEVSPYHQVTNTAPPTILFYGALDPLIPVTQGIDMSNKLDILGVPNHFTLYPHGGHGWIGTDLLDTSVKLKTFIETHFE